MLQHLLWCCCPSPTLVCWTLVHPQKAAPAWLRGHSGGRGFACCGGGGGAGGAAREDDDDKKKEEEEEECDAACEWLVSVVSEDLYTEMMDGPRFRRWVP